MNRYLRFRVAAPLILLISSILACNFPREGTPTLSGSELLKTYAAQTIQVQLTIIATGLQPTITPGPPGATATLENSITPTSEVEATLTPSATQGVCDQAEFEKDVNYPDNSTLSPGEEFTKTWRLRNSGTCTWNSNYAIVFDRGDSLGAPASSTLTTTTVAPGETVDVSVVLKAPESSGTYQGYWKLRNQAGQKFGLGEDGDKDFWVKIKVGTVSGVTFDFNVNSSSANWVGSDGGSSAEVPFNGPDDDPNGVAKIKDNFLLENGSQSGVALVTGPKKTENGRISGTFPAYSIEDNDHFKAKLGFIQGCGGGKVVFRFGIKEGGNTQTFAEWNKTCDGSLVFVDEDLSGFVGKEVQFVLTVLADGSIGQDLVVWGSARIDREG